jgi:acyl-coenzyme A thioesterase PaaI-like protein
MRGDEGRGDEGRGDEGRGDEGLGDQRRAEPTAGDIPPGFAPRQVNGRFLEPFGPLYLRRDAAGASTFGVRILPAHCNAKDMAHGGMMATLADIVLGIGGLEQAGAPGFFITISLQTDFLGPAMLGAWVECRPELLRRTRTLMFVQGVFAADGRPALRASGVFQLPKPEAPAG